MTRPPHPAAQLFADEHLAGKLSRREFLSRATMLGVSATAAYSMIGLALPTPARAQATRGGTLRVNMETKALKDPRTWDWTEYANFCRGWLDYLTQFNRDGTVTGVLCESWEANDDATQYTLHLRRGVSWNNGDPFTAADVAHNFARWADSTVEGNSMATRVGALQDPDTGQLAEGAVDLGFQQRSELLGLSGVRVVGPLRVSDAAATDLRGELELTGPVPRSEMLQQYAWADVFLMPSISEGSANVCYEALGSGLPVITTHNTGSVVRDGSEGFVVPIRDSEAIAARIEELAIDGRLRREMSQQARRRATEFGWESYSERLLAAIGAERIAEQPTACG